MEWAFTYLIGACLTGLYLDRVYRRWPASCDQPTNPAFSGLLFCMLWPLMWILIVGITVKDALTRRSNDESTRGP